MVNVQVEFASMRTGRDLQRRLFRFKITHSQQLIEEQLGYSNKKRGYYLSQILSNESKWSSVGISVDELSNQLSGTCPQG